MACNPGHIHACMQAMQSTRNTLMDSYEYVMYGRIFKYMDAGGNSDQVSTLSFSRHCQRQHTCLGMLACCDAIGKRSGLFYTLLSC